MKFRILFVIMIPAVIGAGCGKQGTESLPAVKAEQHSHAHEPAEKFVHLAPAQLLHAGLKLGLPEERAVEGRINVTGVARAEPNSRASVHPPIHGYIDKIHVIPGSFARAGTALATLKHPAIIQLQEDYLKTNSRLKFLGQEKQRQKDLQQDNVGYLRKLQQAEADYQTAQTELGALKARMEFLHLAPPTNENAKLVSEVSILAPIDGTVEVININVGAYVTEDKQLFEMVNGRDLHLDLQVFEQDVERVAVGQAVEVGVAGKPARYPARIIAVGRQIDEQSRTLSVHAHLINDNSALTLKPGMYLAGGIEAAAVKRPVVPEEAVVQNANRAYIFVTKNEKDRFEMLEVQTGAAADGYVQITPFRALKSDEKVVLSGAYYLLAEMRKGEGDESGHAH